MTAERAPVAIVTGGGAGIGAAACHRLAADGFHVLVCDIDLTSADDVAAAIARSGGQADALHCDVSQEADWLRVYAYAAGLGRLTAVVSNAGIYPKLALAECTVADFDRVLAVNLRAAFLCVSLGWKAIQGGAFVVMTSGAALMTAAGNPMQIGFSLYGASKAALDRWSAGIAPELVPAGIAINLLCPGALVHTTGIARTDFGEHAPADSISAETVAAAIAQLARVRPPETGRRYLATEFGRGWGGD